MCARACAYFCMSRGVLNTVSATNVRMRACVRARIYMRLYMCVCVCVCVYIYIYIHIIYMCECMRLCIFLHVRGVLNTEILFVLNDTIEILKSPVYRDLRYVRENTLIRGGVPYIYRTHAHL